MCTTPGPGFYQGFPQGCLTLVFNVFHVCVLVCVLFAGNSTGFVLEGLNFHTGYWEKGGS